MAKNEAFKRAIEEIKLKFGKKQAEIAQDLGVKSNYLSDMINGRVPLTTKITDKIYELYQVKVWESTSEGRAVQPAQMEMDFSAIIESNSKMANAVDKIAGANVTLADSNKILVESNRELTGTNAKLAEKCIDVIERMLQTMTEIGQKIDKKGDAGTVGGVAPLAAQG